MTEAIFGLVGVIVGAAITGGFEVWSDGRRRKSDLRQATRLVAQDVYIIHLTSR